MKAEIPTGQVLSMAIVVSALGAGLFFSEALRPAAPYVVLLGFSVFVIYLAIRREPDDADRPPHATLFPHDTTVFGSPLEPPAAEPPAEAPAIGAAAPPPAPRPPRA